MSGSENDETASESDFRTDEATEVVSASTRAPINMLSIQKNNGGAPGNVSVSVAEVEIELTEDLKKKLVNDLSSICSVDDVTARKMLNENRWNMQVYKCGTFNLLLICLVCFSFFILAVFSELCFRDASMVSSTPRILNRIMVVMMTP